MQGGDAHSTSRVLVALVEICFEGQDLELLNETVVVLTKKRSQIKMAVTKMVQKCCEYVDKIPDKETKLKLMDTLRLVCTYCYVSISLILIMLSVQD